MQVCLLLVNELLLSGSAVMVLERRPGRLSHHVQVGVLHHPHPPQPGRAIRQECSPRRLTGTFTCLLTFYCVKENVLHYADVPGLAVGRGRGVQQPGPAAGRVGGGVAAALQSRVRPHPRATDTRALDPVR